MGIEHMQECHDEIKEDDGAGQQSIFRIVRIPFKVHSASSRN